MTERRFENKSSLKQWLVSAAGIVLTSVSLMSDIQDVEFQFSTPKQLSTVMENAPDHFPEGEYLVRYKNSDDLDEDDLDYSKMAMVVSFEAKLARGNKLVVGLQPLLKDLSDFEYCCTIDKSNPAYRTAAIWVLEPRDPSEMRKLEYVLSQKAVFYAFNDGSGFVTLNNARMGKGIHQMVEIQQVNA